MKDHHIFATGRNTKPAARLREIESVRGVAGAISVNTEIYNEYTQKS